MPVEGLVANVFISTRVIWSIQSILLNFRRIYSCTAEISQLQNIRKNDNYVKKKNYVTNQFLKKNINLLDMVYLI
jgi:hypothetical protein